MIEVPLTEEALRGAFQRIHDFKVVHKGEDDIWEYWLVLRKSLGIDEERIAQIVGEAERVFNTPEEKDDAYFFPGLLFGLVLGLIAADYAREKGA